MKRIDRQRQREGTAYHEAGHCVAAYHGNWPIERVTIKRNITSRHPPSLGHVAWGDGELDQRWAGVMAAAGEIAEAKHLGEPVAWPCAGTDRDIMYKHLRDSGKLEGDDWLKVGNELEAEAKAFVERHWCQIEVIAQALLKKRTLSGGQVKRLLSGRKA